MIINSIFCIIENEHDNYFFLRMYFVRATYPVGLPMHAFSVFMLRWVMCMFIFYCLSKELYSFSNDALESLSL